MSDSICSKNVKVTLEKKPIENKQRLHFINFDQTKLLKVLLYFLRTELKTLECDILNPDLLINLEIKKKNGSSINPDIHHSKVPSSERVNAGTRIHKSAIQ